MFSSLTSLFFNCIYSVSASLHVHFNSMNFLGMVQGERLLHELFVSVAEGSCLIIISLQSHVRRVLPCTHVNTRWLAHLQNKLSSRY